MSVVLSFIAFLGATGADDSASRAVQDVEDAYAAYFGRAAVDKQIVAVKPDGSSILVTWDLQKAAEAGDAPPGAFKMAPFSYRLTPGENGVWTLNSDKLPRIEFDVKSEQGSAKGAFDFDGVALEGRFDPNHEPFLTGSGKIAALRADIANTDPHNASHVLIDERDLAFDLRGQTAGGGGVDVATATTVGHVAETIAADDPKGPDAVKLESAGVVGASNATGLRAREIGQLWRYAVAHAGDQTAQRGAVPLLGAALPLWNGLEARADLKDLAVQSPLGSANIKSFGESMSSTGVVDAAKFQIGFDFQDLMLNFVGAPPWAASLTPATLKLTVGVSDTGIAEAARLLLADKPDADGKTSPETTAAMQRAVLAGHPKLVIEPGRLKTPAIDFGFQGEAALDLEAKSAHLQLSADSLDKVMAIVGDLAKSQPDMQQAVLTLSLAKGLAKPGPDGRLTWDVVVAGDAVTVNGSPLSGGAPK